MGTKPWVWIEVSPARSMIGAMTVSLSVQYEVLPAIRYFSPGIMTRETKTLLNQVSLILPVESTASA